MADEIFQFSELFEFLSQSQLQRWLDTLPQDLEQALRPNAHGQLERWQTVIASLPDFKAKAVNLSQDTIQIGQQNEIEPLAQPAIEAGLRQLLPWRKGPFSVFDISIDAEWRSDMKWRRVEPHISDLRDRLVLDVGSGNGYFTLRMAGAGAKRAIGLDPTLLFVAQFHALKRFLSHPRADVLPLPLEALPDHLQAFDTVFSMGVLYHRRSPIDHLFQLRNCLRPGGELILETLIVEGGEGYSLMPQQRYAHMRNVWFIPSLKTLDTWLKRCRFTHIRCVDVSRTSPTEQRSTPWMPGDSLEQFLHPRHADLTIEGYPAPRRAVLLANRA